MTAFIYEIYTSMMVLLCMVFDYLVVRLLVWVVWKSCDLVPIRQMGDTVDLIQIPRFIMFEAGDSELISVQVRALPALVRGIDIFHYNPALLRARVEIEEYEGRLPAPAVPIRRIGRPY